MSNLQARVTVSDKTFHVKGYERIEYDLTYVDGVFAIATQTSPTTTVPTVAH
jgi:3-dehydroquinate synthase